MNLKYFLWKIFFFFVFNERFFKRLYWNFCSYFLPPPFLGPKLILKKLGPSLPVPGSSRLTSPTPEFRSDCAAFARKRSKAPLQTTRCKKRFHFSNWFPTGIEKSLSFSFLDLPSERVVRILGYALMQDNVANLKANSYHFAKKCVSLCHKSQSSVPLVT